VKVKAPIRDKIILSFLAVAIGTILLMGLIMRRAIDTELTGYARRNQESRSQQLVDALENGYQQTGDWSFLPAFYHYAPVGALEFAVYDPGQRLIFSSRDYQRPRRGMGPNANSLVRGDTRVYDLEGVDTKTKIGSVAITPLGLDGLLSAQDRLFRTTLFRSLFRAAIVAATVAFLLALFLSGQIVNPLRKITAAATRLAAGNLKTKVPVETADELAELAQTLNTMSARLLKLEELRRQLTQDVAHELKTPLASARALVEGMSDGIIPADRGNLLSLLEEIDRLSQLIGDLGELSRAEAGRNQLVMVPGNPAAVVAAVGKRLRPAFDEKGVALELAASLKDVKAQALIDERALERIFENLLSNALRHTAKGGLVRISTRQDPEAGSIAFTVSDNGVGIPAQHLPYIFERFYRVDPSRSRATGGTGIGLTIVRELTEALGGQVSVKSHPGQGTSFTIMLPLMT
jgi:signal transduction histidine kinase